MDHPHPPYLIHWQVLLALNPEITLKLSSLCPLLSPWCKPPSALLKEQNGLLWPPGCHPIKQSEGSFKNRSFILLFKAFYSPCAKLLAQAWVQGPTTVVLNLRCVVFFFFSSFLYFLKFVVRKLNMKFILLMKISVYNTVLLLYRPLELNPLHN